jgi:hypothetical protein
VDVRIFRVINIQPFVGVKSDQDWATDGAVNIQFRVSYSDVLKQRPFVKVSKLKKVIFALHTRWMHRNQLFFSDLNLFFR